MKTLGVILSIIVWFIIVIIPTLDIIDKWGASIAGISQGFIAAFCTFKFYNWFKSNIKEQ